MSRGFKILLLCGVIAATASLFSLVPFPTVVVRTAAADTIIARQGDTTITERPSPLRRPLLARPQVVGHKVVESRAVKSQS